MHSYLVFKVDLVLHGVDLETHTKEVDIFESSSKFPKSLLRPSEAVKVDVKKVKILCNPFSGKPYTF